MSPCGLGAFGAKGAPRLTSVKTHLAVVQLAELLNDPLLQDESFPQLFPVVLDRHLALLLLHRVVPGDGAGPNATHSGRSLEEDAAAGGGQRGTGLGAGGRHVVMRGLFIKQMCE